jgi:hypothetical protein
MKNRVFKNMSVYRGQLESSKQNMNNALKVINIFDIWHAWCIYRFIFGL